MLYYGTTLLVPSKLANKKNTTKKNTSSGRPVVISNPGLSREKRVLSH